MNELKEFMGNLLSMGMKRETVLEKAYDFALALGREQQPEGAEVSAAMMARAAELVKDALPGAYRIYESRNRMW